VSALEEHRFDESYIEFLDTQIRLNARGNDWTDRLKQRRKALAPFLNLMLIRGKVNAGGKMFTVEIDPRGPRVVYWEQYEEDESEQQLPSG
jgi:hypothetical protein